MHFNKVPYERLNELMSCIINRNASGIREFFLSTQGSAMTEADYESLLSTGSFEITVSELPTPANFIQLRAAIESQGNLTNEPTNVGD